MRVDGLMLTMISSIVHHKVVKVRLIGGSCIMARPHELRQKAELCRRLASTPTEGGKMVDNILIALAERLEREAEMELEERGNLAGAART